MDSARQAYRSVCKIIDAVNEREGKAMEQIQALEGRMADSNHILGDITGRT